VINFGILYGMSAYGLSQTWASRPREAEKFITAYLDRYPGVKRYVEENPGIGEKEGKVETLYAGCAGCPTSRARIELRENARRMAINARIQGTAADLLKLAMIAVGPPSPKRGLAARLLLTVHDELFGGPEGEVEAAAKNRQGGDGRGGRARGAPGGRSGFGKSWYEAKT